MSVVSLIEELIIDQLIIEELIEGPLTPVGECDRYFSYGYVYSVLNGTSSDAYYPVSLPYRQIPTDNPRLQSPTWSSQQLFPRERSLPHTQQHAPGERSPLMNFPRERFPLERLPRQWEGYL
jgi:hypothetical protein